MTQVNENQITLNIKKRLEAVTKKLTEKLDDDTRSQLLDELSILSEQLITLTEVKISEKSLLLG